MLLLYITFLWLAINPTQSITTNFSVFILAGQSNMAGRGGVLIKNTSSPDPVWDGVVPTQCRPSPSILRLDAALRWVEAHEPLHWDIDINKMCGVGPGMPFAHAILGDGSGPVGLVPCAVGGTSINHWARGTALYQQMMKRARASTRHGGTIEAVIWYQGESDTVFEDGATSYGNKLNRFLSDLRADMRQPLLPIIVVAIASGEGQYIEKVRKSQLGINLLNVIVVDAMGLPLGPDNLHLTTSAQVNLGQKLARAYLKLRHQSI